MRQSRVLIVDDSVTIRRSLTESLSQEPDVIVAGVASNGRIALMKIPLLRPDVVALDIEMPEMDGLATLAAIRDAYPQTTVIMLSEPSDRGTAATLDALALGAKDYVTKPETAVKGDDALRMLSSQLAVKIALHSPQAVDVPAGPPLKTLSLRDAKPVPAAARTPVRVDVLAIGVSTGGPNALMDLIPRFPEDFPVPILVVQHMPPMFTRLLAERLNGRSRLRVAEARPSQPLTPGAVWIAPGDFHMAVVREGETVMVRTHQGRPEQSCRPSADILFCSVAQVYGPHAMAVVMTGMGRDGFHGCEDIHAAGGQVLIQDQASSIVWGMPGAIARADMADRVVPLDGLAVEIMDRVAKFRDRIPAATAPGR
jgi:two-component system, chemotaxis family, protein-glutamate methylesterase/glutaminase